MSGHAMLLKAALAVGLSAPMPPYYGLDKDSYGQRALYSDSRTHTFVGPPSCDPNAKYADVNELARQITGLIFKPVRGLAKVDEEVKKEDLQSFFLMPGDPGNTPSVALLSRGPSEITFWYKSDLISFGEVVSAAKAFCKRMAKQALYAGTSKRCGPPIRMPVIVNGQTTMTETYAISSFECAVGEGDVAGGDPSGLQTTK